MKRFLLLGIRLLAATVTCQAHTQPALPKEVQHLDHLRKAFAHHEVQPLPVKMPALPDSTLVVPYVPAKLIALEADKKALPAAPRSVPLVAGSVISPATPPPSR